jgi:tetratricopeptide (TPR) repeat protein
LEKLETADYERILERIYFSVATELYKQIRQDVENKVALLPSAYFRAVALYHEAEDYARSNTLDAYEEARKLYDKSAKLFDPSLKSLPNSSVQRLLHRIRHSTMRLSQRLKQRGAYLWPRLGHVQLMCAKAEIGYANMLLFRRSLAHLSGQRLNPIFEARPVVERAVERLQRLPEDGDERRQYLFDAYVTLASAWYLLGSLQRAEKCLTEANRLDPNRADVDARYLRVKADIETDTRFRLQLYQRAVELQPRFELAHFSYALEIESLWRTRSDFERNVAELALKEYEKVTNINPGNLGSWANQGYIY